MALSRNERRKAAKARRYAKTLRLVKAHNAAVLDRVRKIVGNNSITYHERDISPANSMAGMKGVSHRGYVCKASGGMSRQGALSLKAKGHGSTFASDVNPDAASQLGQHLSGKAIRDASKDSMTAKLGRIRETLTVREGVK